MVKRVVKAINKRGKRRFIAEIVVVSLCIYAGAMALMNNFHVVVPGEFYRSGQLSGGDIRYYAKRYGLRSVINLRGDNAGTAWYDHEVSEAHEAGVKHVDFKMSAKHVVSREEALALIAAMRTAPKPLLIHCNGGANRTSLAAALYMAAIKKTDERTAESQMSILFGNFPTWLGSKSRMNESFELLEPMLGYSGS